MASVDSAGAHAAWGKSVAEQAAARGVSLEEVSKPPPEDAAWFQSAHSRRTEGMREPLPADERRAAEGPASEGVVKELRPAQPPQRSQEKMPMPQQPAAAAAAAPAPPKSAAAQPPAPPKSAAPPRAPQPPRAKAVPPLPEMAQSWFGVSLIDWIGPLVAVLVGVLSIQVFARTNGPQGAATLPAGRYFSPVTRVAALSAKLYDEIKGAFAPWAQ